MEFEFDFAMIHLKKKVFCLASTLLFCQASAAQGVCRHQLSSGKLLNFRSEHIEEASTILNEPEVSAYLHSYAPDEIADKLEKMIRHENNSMVKGFWSGDELVALIGLYEDQKQLEWIAKTEVEKKYFMLWFAVKGSKQGQGFGSSATHAFLKFLFEQTDVPGVFACFEKQNLSSRILIAKLHFSNSIRRGPHGLVCAHITRQQFISSLLVVGKPNRE